MAAQCLFTLNIQGVELKTKETLSIFIDGLMHSSIKKFLFNTTNKQHFDKLSNLFNIDGKDIKMLPV